MRSSYKAYWDMGPSQIPSICLPCIAYTIRYYTLFNKEINLKCRKRQHIYYTISNDIISEQLIGASFQFDNFSLLN